MLPCLLLCLKPCLLHLRVACWASCCLLPFWPCLESLGRCGLVCAVRRRGSAASRVHRGMGSTETEVRLHHEHGGRSRAVAESGDEAEADCR